MEKPLKVFVPLPLAGGFQVSDKVVDITAIENQWPDQRGTVIEVDGSMVKVRYDSGAMRWKMHINLRKDE